MELENIFTNNKICMILNGIIGDVYGAPIEMAPREYLVSKYGIIMTDYIKTDKVAERMYSYTDDTEMTLSVIKFLLQVKNEKLFNEENMLKSYIENFEPFRGYSSKISKLFMGYIETNNLKLAYSQGNGGIMRISPLLFVCKSKSDDELIDMVKIIHYPTHLDEECIYTSYVYIKILRKLEEIYYMTNKKCELLKYLTELEPKLKFNIKNNIKFILSNLDSDEYDVMDTLIGLDGILCWETLSVALWCLIKNIDTVDKKTILAKGIFYGGDCDTIGSIIGQMVGLLFGSNAINIKWLKNVENINSICLLIKNLEY